MSDRFRVGIDVGGTFTHAVALFETADLAGAVKVPTTHEADEGVARGVVQALERLLCEAAIAPSAVVRVAHSTTQATNALLQGDVSPVGIVAAGSGWEGQRVRSQTDLGSTNLWAGRRLVVHHRFVEVPVDGPDEEALRKACSDLAAQGAQALVAAAAFSVDDPSLEELVVGMAHDLGIPATATHEISHLYGLRVRTRTAAINAAILPRMIETATRTEQAVRALGITAPVVVMRSDGGAMDISEMRKRPVLTILSGPAAGIAAALMAARVADGLFVEVGGTSTDISCIQDGHPHVRTAHVGDHRLFLNTLDVRTVGVAGGSMVRVAETGDIKAVGPRSAHIAGLRYSCFSDESGLSESVVAVAVAPRPGDPPDHLALSEPDGDPTWTITPTCAANYLGTLPPGFPARGDETRVRRAFEAVGDHLGVQPGEVARRILDVGARALEQVIHDLVDEYELEPDATLLVGGGGGAGVWLPVLGDRNDLPATIVDQAPVISAIGAALALLQETVERNLIDPSPEDVAQIRAEARKLVTRAGAVPDSVEVRVEVDAQRGILRATAVGCHEMTTDRAELDVSELSRRAAGVMRLETDGADCVFRAGRFAVFRGRVTRKRFWGLFEQVRSPWTILDRHGRTRASAAHGELYPLEGTNLIQKIEPVLEESADFGDAGMLLPSAFLVTDTRLLDLSGMADLKQRIAVCRDELAEGNACSQVLLAIKRS